MLDSVKHFYIVNEYINCGKTLNEYMIERKGLTTEEIAKIIRQILLGVNYLHK